MIRLISLVKRPTLWVIIATVAGVLGTRMFWPRTVDRPVLVDREVVRTVERLVPGKTRTIYRDVPGPERKIPVPVEVERRVEVEVVREKPVIVERIVTTTRPVDVPVEVIRREWPQAITVRVGGVLVYVQNAPSWATPVHQDLTIGQVTPGVYAVSGQMPGWRIDEIRTETRIDTPRPDPLPYHLGLTVGTFSERPFSGITYQNRAFGGVYQIHAGYSWPGAIVAVLWTVPVR